MSDELYVGYCDWGKRDKKVSSLLFAKFDLKTLNEREKEYIENYFNNGSSDYEMINAYPYAFFAFDRTYSKDGIIYDKEVDQEWSMQVDNINKTKEKAFLALKKEAFSKQDTVERLIIEMIMSGYIY